jgi:single-strand DNA-binding protein
MFNRISVIGNLTKDVELKQTDSGAIIAKFSVAVNRRWKDKNNGEDREETTFIDVKIFGKSAENAGQYLAKGKRVLVDGRLIQERWVTESGENRSKHLIIAESIQYLDKKEKTEAVENSEAINDDENGDYVEIDE